MQTGGKPEDYLRPQTYHPNCDFCRTNIRGRDRILRLFDQQGGGMRVMFFCGWRCLEAYAERKLRGGYT